MDHASVEAVMPAYSISSSSVCAWLQRQRLEARPAALIIYLLHKYRVAASACRQIIVLHSQWALVTAHQGMLASQKERNTRECHAKPFHATKQQQNLLFCNCQKQAGLSVNNQQIFIEFLVMTKKCNFAVAAFPLNMKWDLFNFKITHEKKLVHTKCHYIHQRPVFETVIWNVLRIQKWR